MPEDKPEGEMQGYVYIMSNPAHGLLKIGKSERPPIERKRELDAATGVSHPFALEYEAFVANHHLAEQRIHANLDAKRQNKRREFFDLSVPEAIVAIRAATDIISETVHYRSQEEIAEESARQAHLRAERTRREEREALRREATERWLSEQNTPAQAARDALIKHELAEAQQMFGLGGVVSTAIVAYNFGLGPAILAAGASVVVFAYAVKANRLKQAEIAAIRYPFKTEDDYRKQVREDIACPRCRQRVRLPTRKVLDVRCPRCSKQWRTGT